jgi:hypothetical protein
MLPRFEIARRTVYESDGSPENTNVLTIFCENENSELLKTLLVAADLDKNELGMFMLLTTRLSNGHVPKASSIHTRLGGNRSRRTAPGCTGRANTQWTSNSSFNFGQADSVAAGM